MSEKRKRRPYYNYFPADFEEGTRHFEPASKGLFQTLLNHQHAHDYIPSDPRAIQKVAGFFDPMMPPGLTPEQAAMWHELSSPFTFAFAWSQVSEKFVKDADGNLRNPRMEADRLEYLEHVAKKSLAGKASAAKRASVPRRTKGSGKHSTPVGPEPQHPLPKSPTPVDPAHSTPVASESNTCSKKDPFCCEKIQPTTTTTIPTTTTTPSPTPKPTPRESESETQTQVGNSLSRSPEEISISDFFDAADGNGIDPELAQAAFDYYAPRGFRAGKSSDRFRASDVPSIMRSWARREKSFRGDGGGEAKPLTPGNLKIVLDALNQKMEAYYNRHNLGASGAREAKKEQWEHWRGMRDRRDGIEKKIADFEA